MTNTHFTFADGRSVNRMGYGAMRLTGQPGNFGPYPEWDAGLALLRQASDLGVDVFDSARAYGPLHADRLVLLEPLVDLCGHAVNGTRAGQ